MLRWTISVDCDTPHDATPAKVKAEIEALLRAHEKGWRFAVFEAEPRERDT